MQKLIMHDLKLCIYAIVFVIIYSLIHTGSPFLAICGMVNIIHAFPLALFIYREIFGYKGALPLLSVAAVFVIIGIAVDDIFVFVDMWKQAKSDTFRGPSFTNYKSKWRNLWM